MLCVNGNQLIRLHQRETTKIFDAHIVSYLSHS